MTPIDIEIDSQNYKAFIQLLTDNDVVFSRRIRLSESFESLAELITILPHATAAPLAVIAYVLSVWIKTKSNREIRYQDKDGNVLVTKGYSQKEFEEMLSKTKKVKLIEKSHD